MRPLAHIKPYRCAAVVMPILTAALVLSGCNAIRKDADAGIKSGQTQSAAQRARLKAVMNGEVIREERPWYGRAILAKPAPVRGKKLPARFEGARGFALKLPGQADVKTIAAAVTGGTDIQVNIRTRYILPNGDGVRVPIGTRMAVDYEGPLSAFLERMAARMDVAWDYDGTVINIDRMINRDYRIALPNGQTEYTSTATGLGTTNTNIKTTRAIDIWKDLEDRLKPLAPPPARITVSPEAGRISVFGPPSVQALVKRIVEEAAVTAATRIGLEVAVFFVDSDKMDAFSSGLGISPILGETVISTNLEAAETFAGSDMPGGISIANGRGRLDFRALAKDRAVFDYRLGSSVAQSGVVSPIKVSRSVNYIKSVSTTQSSQRADETDTTTETDTVETGISIIALPRLVDHRTIQLSLTLVQSDLVDIVASRNNVELPITEQREIRSETVLAPGETLVLSGYEMDVTRSEDRGLGVLRRIGLGGVSGRKRQRVSLIVLVRPTIVAKRRR